MTASGASSYLWNTSDAVASISVSPTANTNYTVTGTNAEGCVNTKTVTLKVLPCVGINELNGENYQLSIYPNPSNGNLEIIGLQANPQPYQIMNSMGQIILQGEIGQQTNTINISHLAANIYFLQIGFQTLKIVKADF